MRTNHYIITLVALLIAGALLGGMLVRSCQNEQPTITQSDTLPGDSILYPISIEVPSPVYIDSSFDILVSIFGIDTAEVIRDYFRTKYYQDTIIEAGNFRLVVKDSVTLNRIVWRSMEHQNLRSTSITNTIVMPSELNNPAIYLGGDILCNSQRVYIGPSVMLRGRKPQYYKIGVTFSPTEGYRSMISFGYYQQINIRK